MSRGIHELNGTLWPGAGTFNDTPAMSRGIHPGETIDELIGWYISTTPRR